MKILKTDYFISERIKVQPITNAELDAARKEMNTFRKIENPTAEDVKAGMAVSVQDSKGNNIIYIVFDSTSLPPYFSDIAKEYKFAGNLVLIRYYHSKPNDFSYRSFEFFKKMFPKNCTQNIKITAVYDAGINTLGINSADDLYAEWDNVCKKIASYKQ